MGWPRIVIGTSNRGKVREISRLYADLPVEWVAMGDLGRPPETAETGATFRENARLKAEAVARWSGLPALAEDSGLEVDALGGAPGAYSARFAGPDATDAENVALLLRRLAGVPIERRTARFRACAVLWWVDGCVDEADGACEGRIASAPSGRSGFGYDPVFIPEGQSATFADLGREVKDRLSHRARALEGLRPAIMRRVAAGPGDVGKMVGT